MVTEVKQKVIPGVITAPGEMAAAPSRVAAPVPGVITAPGQAAAPIAEVAVTGVTGISGISGEKLVSIEGIGEVTPEEKAKFEEEHLQVGPEGAKEWITKAQFEELEEDQREALKELGVVGYETWFAEKYVQVGPKADEGKGQWISKTQLGEMDKDQREALEKWGVEGYGKWFEANYVQVGPGEGQWVSGKQLSDMSEDQREALKELGVVGYETWFRENYEPVGPVVEGEERSWVPKAWITENLAESFVDKEGREVNPQALYRELGPEGYQDWFDSNYVAIGVDVGEEDKGFASAYELSQMEPEAREAMISGGQTGYDTWFGTNYVEVGEEGSDDFVSREFLEGLDKEDREALEELGSEGYDAFTDEKYEKIVPIEGPDAGKEVWMDRGTLEGMDPEALEALRKGGTAGYQEWFGQNYIEIGTDYEEGITDDKGKEFRGYIHKSDLAQMPSEYQELVASGGIQAFQEAFDRDYEAVGPEVEDLADQEYVGREFLESMEKTSPEGAEAYREGGKEGYDAWFDTKYQKVGTSEGIAQNIRELKLRDVVEPVRSQVKVIPAVPSIRTNVDMSKRENQLKYMRVGTGTGHRTQYILRSDYTKIRAQNPEVAGWISRDGQYWQRNLGRYVSLAGGSSYISRGDFESLRREDPQIASKLASLGIDGVENWVNTDWKIPPDQLEPDVVEKEWLQKLSEGDRESVMAGGLSATDVEYVKIQPADGSEEVWIGRGEYDLLEKGRKEALQLGGLQEAQEWESANYKTLGVTGPEGYPEQIAIEDWNALKEQVETGAISEDELKVLETQGCAAFSDVVEARVSQDFKDFQSDNRIVYVKFKDASGNPITAIDPNDPTKEIEGAVWINRDVWEGMSHGERAEYAETGKSTGTINVRNRKGEDVEVSRWEWNKKDTKAKLHFLGWKQPDSSRYVSFAMQEKAAAGDDRYMDPELMKLSRSHGFHGKIRQHDKPKWKWKGVEGYWEYYTIDLPNDEKERYDQWKKQWNRLRDIEYKNYSGDYGGLAVVGEVINDFVGLAFPAVRAAKPGVDVEEISGMEWFMTGIGAATMVVPAAASVRGAKLASAAAKGSTVKTPFYLKPLGTWRGVGKTVGVKAPTTVGKVGAKAAVKVSKAVAKPVGRMPTAIPKVSVAPGVSGRVAVAVKPMAVSEVVSGLGTKVVRPVVGKISAAKATVSRFPVAEKWGMAPSVSPTGQALRVKFGLPSETVAVGVKPITVGDIAAGGIKGIRIAPRSVIGAPAKAQAAVGARVVARIERVTAAPSVVGAARTPMGRALGLRSTVRPVGGLGSVARVSPELAARRIPAVGWVSPGARVPRVPVVSARGTAISLGRLGIRTGGRIPGTSPVVRGVGDIGAFGGRGVSAVGRVGVSRVPGIRPIVGGLGHLRQAAVRRGVAPDLAKQRLGMKMMWREWSWKGPPSPVVKGRSMRPFQDYRVGVYPGPRKIYPKPGLRDVPVIAKPSIGKLEGIGVRPRKPKRIGRVGRVGRVVSKAERKVVGRPKSLRARRVGPKEPVSFEQVGARLVERPIAPEVEGLLLGQYRLPPVAPPRGLPPTVEAATREWKAVQAEWSGFAKAMEPPPVATPSAKTLGLKLVPEKPPTGVPTKVAPAAALERIPAKVVAPVRIATKEATEWVVEPVYALKVGGKPVSRIQDVVKRTRMARRYRPMVGKQVRRVPRVQRDVTRAVARERVISGYRPTGVPSIVTMDVPVSPAIARPGRMMGISPFVSSVKGRISLPPRETVPTSPVSPEKPRLVPIISPVGAPRITTAIVERPEEVPYVGPAEAPGGSVSISPFVGPTEYVVEEPAPQPIPFPSEEPQPAPLEVPSPKVYPEPSAVTAPELVSAAKIELMERPYRPMRPERVPERVSETTKRPVRPLPLLWIPGGEEAEEPKRKVRGKKRRTALEALPMKEGALLLHMPKVASVKTTIVDPLSPRALDIWQTTVLKRERVRPMARIGTSNERRSNGEKRGRIGNRGTIAPETSGMKRLRATG